MPKSSQNGKKCLPLNTITGAVQHGNNILCIMKRSNITMMSSINNGHGLQAQTLHFYKIKTKQLFVILKKKQSKMKMVFCYQNCSDLLWLKKKIEIRDWRPRIRKIFEITRTIYSNSERSEQFLVTECFFNLFLEVSHV